MSRITAMTDDELGEALAEGGCTTFRVMLGAVPPPPCHARDIPTARCCRHCQVTREVCRRIGVQAPAEELFAPVGKAIIEAIDRKGKITVHVRRPDGRTLCGSRPYMTQVCDPPSAVNCGRCLSPPWLSRANLASRQRTRERKKARKENRE